MTTLSREARILIGILFLAAAAWIWLNFFNQTTPTQVTTPAPQTSANSSVAPVNDDALADTSVTDDAAEDSASSATTGTPTTDATAETNVSPATNGTTVSVAPDTVTVARDLEVVQLPFLITEPPSASLDTEEGEDGDTSLTRPNGQRASVNPFSPILIQQAAAPPSPSTPQVVQPTIPEPEIVEVSVPDTTGIETVATAPREPVQAPAPRALTPPAPRASNLPRSLPGGTLPVVPDVLRSSRADSSAAQAPELATVAVIREPSGDSVDATNLGTSLVSVASEEQASSIPELIMPGATQAPSTVNDPLAAGITPLSRHLRDNNVKFTGLALGPVGVGVFRSADIDGPVVLTLGQKLPDTDIVLTDLEGKQAEFTQATYKQLIPLNPPGR